MNIELKILATGEQKEIVTALKKFIDELEKEEYATITKLSNTATYYDNDLRDFTAYVSEADNNKAPI